MLRRNPPEKSQDDNSNTSLTAVLPLVVQAMAILSGRFLGSPVRKHGSQLIGRQTRPNTCCSSAKPSLNAGPSWPKFLSTLGVTGCIAGPLLDAIHSRVQLQVYDALPVDIVTLDLHTSLLVPPLLAAFYIVLGVLTLSATKLRESWILSCCPFVRVWTFAISTYAPTPYISLRKIDLGILFVLQTF